MVLLPETLRPIAGNGTVKLTGMHKPFIYSITGQKGVIEGALPDARKGKVTWRAVFAPLTFLIEKDVFITLFFGSVVYTVWSMVTSSTTDLFSEVYGLSSLQIGLTFLGNGKHDPTRTRFDLRTIAHALHRVWMHVRIVLGRLSHGL